MRFFKRNNTDTAAIPEDLQPYYSSPSSGPGSWIGPVLRIILLLAILALLIWGGIWLFNRLTGDTADESSGAQNTSQSSQNSEASKEAAEKDAAEKKTAEQKAAEQQAAEQKKAAENKAKTSPTPAQATPTPSGAAVPGQPAPAGAPLANTGPGETIALFVLVAAAGALLHRIYLIRTLR